MRKLQILNEKTSTSGVKLFDFVFSIQSANKMNEKKLKKKTKTFVSIESDGVSINDVRLINECKHYLKDSIEVENKEEKYCTNCFVVLK